MAKVKGFGEYHNYYARNWLENEVRVEIYTKGDEVEGVVKAIMETARTGHTAYPGDGVIAVLPIQDLYLIRACAEATEETLWPKHQEQGEQRVA